MGSVRCSLPRSGLLLLALGAGSIVLAGCGTRGALDPPSGAAGPAPQNTAQADSGQGKKEGDAPKPHQGFILDSLLR